MDTLLQANIFFFIASLATVAFTVVLIMVLWRLRKLFNSLNRLVNRLEDTADFVGDETKELVLDIKESSIFRFLFPRKKRVRKSHTSTGETNSQTKKIRRKV